MERVPEPSDGDERSILVGWLAFHRDALEAKCAGLTGQQLTSRSAEPSALSLLGLVRHMTEMEGVYVNWALGPGGALTMVWGEYVEGNPEWDFASEAGQLDESMRAWKDECVAAEQRIASYDSPGEVGLWVMVAACAKT